MSYAVRDLVAVVPEGGRWHFLESLGSASIYENRKAMPRVWLVPETLSITTSNALAAVQTSKLPDGSVYDPSRIALVERDGFSKNVENFDQAASAQVLTLAHSSMTVKTRSASEAFLVTSDVYYPGWVASVDGNTVPLVKTDYAIRGLWLPAGEHTVEFAYRPRSFVHGATLSLISLGVLISLGFLARRRSQWRALR
jgi:hypothetical protein